MDGGWLPFSAKWRALAREASLAAEHMALGVTSLSKANHAHVGLYHQAFFALSVGFERSAKLALLLDHANRHQGAFPEEETVRGYKHDLQKLLAKVDEISVRLKGPTGWHRVPDDPVHQAIVAVLSTFATNITRYYNIDLLTGAVRPNVKDPVAAWHTTVTCAVAAKHYSLRKRETDAARAAALDSLLGEYARVLHTSEDGTAIESVATAHTHIRETEAAKPWTRMYVLQIARSLALTVGALARESQDLRIPDVPYLPDMFTSFNNDDRYFRSRKRWSIYFP